VDIKMPWPISWMMRRASQPSCEHQVELRLLMQGSPASRLVSPTRGLLHPGCRRGEQWHLLTTKTTESKWLNRESMQHQRTRQGTHQVAKQTRRPVILPPQISQAKSYSGYRWQRHSWSVQGTSWPQKFLVFPGFMTWWTTA